MNEIAIYEPTTGGVSIETEEEVARNEDPSVQTSRRGSLQIEEVAKNREYQQDS